jgi:hypothetical protein
MVLGVIRRLPLLIAPAVLLVVAMTSCGSTSQPSAGNIDSRGTWAMVAVADSVQYPQTMRITSENLSTGAVSGTDAGAGLTFNVVGTVSGSKATFTISGSGYTAHLKATVSKSGSSMKMSGTFTDSNQRSGTFTATRTSTSSSA